MVNQPLRVLIVDDVQSEAWIIGKVLQKNLNLQFDIAIDEVEVREKLGQRKYDLITLDYQLKDYNGLDLLGEIQAGEDPPPVLFVTGRSSESIAVEAFKLGALGHINKEADLYDRLIEEARYILTRSASDKAEVATEKEILEQSLLLHDALEKQNKRISGL